MDCNKDDHKEYLCDRVCADHGTTAMLVKQHEERIGHVEDLAVERSNDMANLEGRVTMFIWIVGIVFMMLCSIAFYGLVQVNEFKDIYRTETLQVNKAINNLAATIQLQGDHISDIKTDIKELSDGH